MRRWLRNSVFSYFYYFFLHVPYVGTSRSYLCISITENKVKMKNTDYNIDALGSIISSEDSLSALLGLIDEMGLELTSVRTA